MVSSSQEPGQVTEESPKKHSLWKSMTTPIPDSQLTPAQRWYNSFSSVPMFIVAMAWLVSTFFTWAPSLSGEYRAEGVQISIITWLIFALDLTIRFVLDPRKAFFLKRNWPFLVALAFPPLRIILVITAVMRVARDRNALAKIVGLYAIYAVLFVVIFGGLFTLMFEVNAPGANIISFGDATWWAFVTVTTVGYGDFTPITIGGRVIAVFIMFTGAAAVGAVTAAVASRFINSANANAASAAAASSQDSQASQQSQAPADPHPSPAIGPATPSDPATIDDVLAQVQTLQKQIQSLVDRLGQQPATRGDSGE